MAARAVLGLVWLLRLQRRIRPRGAYLGPSRRLWAVAAANESTALAVLTRRLAFITLLLSCPACVTASLGAVAEVALAFLGIQFELLGFRHVLC